MIIFKFSQSNFGGIRFPPKNVKLFRYIGKIKQKFEIFIPPLILIIDWLAIQLHNLNIQPNTIIISPRKKKNLTHHAYN